MATFKRCHIGMEIQTLLFPKTQFNPSTSRSWLKSHGYLARKLDETDNYYRFRQRSPDSFKPGSFRIISLGYSGVRAIVACPKAGIEGDKRRKLRDQSDMKEGMSKRSKSDHYYSRRTYS